MFMYIFYMCSGAHKLHKLECSGWWYPDLRVLVGLDTLQKGGAAHRQGQDLL